MEKPITSLVDLAQDMHKNSVAHGWYADRDKEDETRFSMTALTHSELSEALECAREGDMALRYETKGGTSPAKPCGFPSEIADTVIRALDFGVWFGITLYEPMRNRRSPGDPEKMTARWCAAMISRIHESVVDEDINAVIQECYDLASLCGFDMDAVIVQKHEYNKTRPIRHGNKAL